MALLSPKKLKKLKENPRAFFVDAFNKKAFPIKNALKRLKPKKKQGFAKYAIISAVYNVEKYLEDYFKSIIHQRLDFKNNILIICVDDGSTDNSAQIIKKYQKKFPQNIVYLHKENGGQASARNLGLRFLQQVTADNTAQSGSSIQQGESSDGQSVKSGVQGGKSGKEETEARQGAGVRYENAAGNLDGHAALAMTGKKENTPNSMDCHALRARNDENAQNGKNLDCHDFATQNLAMTAQNVISQNLAMTNEMEVRHGVKITEQIKAINPKFKEISWVTFTDPDDFLDRDYFYEVDKFLEKNQEIDENLKENFKQNQDKNLKSNLKESQDKNLKKESQDKHLKLELQKNQNENLKLESQENQHKKLKNNEKIQNLHDDIGIRLICTHLLRYFKKGHKKDDISFMKELFKQTFLDTFENTANATLFYANATLFYASAIKNLRFDEKCKPHFEDGKFFLSYMLNLDQKCKVAFIKDSIYYYRQRSNSTISTRKYHLDFFLIVPEAGWAYVLEKAFQVYKKVPLYIQHTILLDLFFRIRDTVGYPEETRILSAEQNEKYFELLKHCFSYIDKEAIIDFDPEKNHDIYYYQKGMLACFKGEEHEYEVVEIYYREWQSNELVLRYYTANLNEEKEILVDKQKTQITFEKIIEHKILNQIFIYEKRLWVKMPQEFNELEIFIAQKRANIIIKQYYQIYGPYRKIKSATLDKFFPKVEE